jgi:hypothetical protein
MLFSYVPFGVTVMVLGCPDYLQLIGLLGGTPFFLLLFQYLSIGQWSKKLFKVGLFSSAKHLHPSSLILSF